VSGTADIAGHPGTGWIGQARLWACARRGLDASPPQRPPGAGATGARGGARGGWMLFWDASGIVPLCLDESWTPLLTQALAGVPLARGGWAAIGRGARVGPGPANRAALCLPGSSVTDGCPT